MNCPTCDGYQLVPGKDGVLERCQDCLAEAVKCPVHGQLVATRYGEIVGKCWGCVNEAAAGMARLQVIAREEKMRRRSVA